MRLKVNDLVILPRSAVVRDTISTPIFGGEFGMVYGRIVKIATNDHDARLHRAIVHWSNGHRWSFREEELKVIDPLNPPVVTPDSTQGLYLFLRPSSSFIGFRVGMISVDFVPGKTTGDEWVSISSRRAVPYDVTEQKLLEGVSNLLPTMATHPTCLDAVNSVLAQNGFDNVTAPEISKLPMFNSFEEARLSEGSCRNRGYLMFTLPST